MGDDPRLCGCRRSPPNLSYGNTASRRRPIAFDRAIHSGTSVPSRCRPPEHAAAHRVCPILDRSWIPFRFGRIRDGSLLAYMSAGSQGKSKLIGFEHDAPDGPIGKLGNLAAPSCAAPCISDRRYLDPSSGCPSPPPRQNRVCKNQDKVESCKGARRRIRRTMCWRLLVAKR